MTEGTRWTSDQRTAKRRAGRPRAGTAARRAASAADRGRPTGAGRRRPSETARGSLTRTGWRRAMADLDNLRKRHARELVRERDAERAAGRRPCCPVIDHLELALEHADGRPGVGRATACGPCATRPSASSRSSGSRGTTRRRRAVRPDAATRRSRSSRTADAEPGTVVAGRAARATATASDSCGRRPSSWPADQG